MPGTSQWIGLCGHTPIAVLFLFALLVGGCATGGGGTPGATPAEATHGYSGSNSLSDYFASSSSAKAPQTATGAQPDVNCPPVEIRRGASTLTIGPTGNKSAMTLKYQGTFARAARECAVVDGNLTMKIGVEGRLIVGPAGGPGQVDVPLRIAIVMETPSGMRPIATKFIIVPVAIGAGVGNSAFTHVEDALTFPLPTPTSQLDDYVVYVGFDPVTAEAQAKGPPKARPKPAASAN
jgi:hypothetical protein